MSYKYEKKDVWDNLLEDKMSNGLNINKDEFLQMPLKKQNLILFENTENLKQNNQELKKMIKSYKFELWTHRITIFALFILVGGGKWIGIL